MSEIWKTGTPSPTRIQFVCMHDDMYNVARESRVDIVAVHLNNVPYFSIDNAHLMYNAHPNAHDAN
jgi:hypothetical protein